MLDYGITAVIECIWGIDEVIIQIQFIQMNMHKENIFNEGFYIMCTLLHISLLCEQVYFSNISDCWTYIPLLEIHD